ncbi:MAG: hypothetical protein JXR21_02960 [Candidatus Marinimicrobia bacterium]|nr:hypothetical protein [Candidatus Neomarinimicrobiota bacterium]
MLHQLLKTAAAVEGIQAADSLRISPDHVVLDPLTLKETGKAMSGDHCAVSTLIISNHMPPAIVPDPGQISVFRKRGATYYPAGRTGMPALVAAEDGFALPGSILVTTDRNLAELGVLGTLVLRTDPEQAGKLLDTGSLDITVPDTFTLLFQGNPGEWIGGIDIALYIKNYFTLPEDPDTVIEIHGEGLANLPLHERFNLARILADFGHERILFQVDPEVMAFLQDRSDGVGNYYFPAEDITNDIVIDLQKIHPMIAWNENGELRIGNLTDKDQSPVSHICIGGEAACRYRDFEAGLKMVRYRPVADPVTACMMPGSQLVAGDLIDMGTAGIFLEIGFELLPSSFLENLTRPAASDPARLGTSVSILRSGGMLAGALSCFSAAMTGRITHPLELESMIKQEETHHHDPKHDEETEI